MTLLARLVLVLAALSLLPAWLLATESGLRAAVAAVNALGGGVLRIASAEGRLSARATLHGFEYADENATVRIGRADVELRLSRLLAGRVQAEWLGVETLEILVPDRPAAPDPEPLTVRTPVYLAVEEGRVRDFRLDVEGTFRWQVPEAEFRARWTGLWIVINRLHVRTREIGDLRLGGRLAIEDDRLWLREHEVVGPGRARVDGALAIAQAAQSRLRVEWEELRPPAAWDLPWLRSPRGSGELTGPWALWRWSVDADWLAAGVAGTVQARGRGSADALHVDRLRTAALGGTLDGDGRIDWSGALLTEAAVAFAGLDPSQRLPEWPGRLSGSARLSALWREARPVIRFETALADSELRGYPLSLRATGTTEGGAVELGGLTLESGPTGLRARGRLWPVFSLAGEIASGDLASVWGGLAGSAQLRWELTGTPAAPVLRAAGEGQALAVAGQGAERLSFEGRFAPEGHSQLRLDLEDVQAAGALWRSLALRGSGTRARYELALDAAAEAGTVHLALAGGERADGWDGQILAVSVARAQEAPWALQQPAPWSYGRARLRVGRACLVRDARRACAGFRHAPGRQELDLELQEIAWHDLAFWLPREWRVSGEVSGRLGVTVADGAVTDLHADLAAGPGSVAAGGAQLAFGPSQLRVQPQDGRLHAHLRARPGAGTVEGDVRLSGGGALLDRGLEGGVQAALPDLSWLPLLSPEIASAQGSLRARLRVSGTLREPSLDGRVDIDGGRLRLTTPGIELTDFDAEFESGAAAPLSLRVAALSGGGRLQLRGALRQLRPAVTGELHLTGENAQWLDTPAARLWVSPDLRLTLAGREARLTGELRVPRAEFTPEELATGGVAPSADQVLVSEAGAQDISGLQLRSEVRVTLGDRVRFDGLGLRTRLEGDLTAFDEPGRPTRARGELRLVGGRYRAYGQDLQIETGRLLFAGGPVTDPSIDLQAFRQPRDDVKVGLRARGPLEAPQFSLYSEPALSQEEQLSWLVLGRSLTETLETGGQAELTGAAASLGLAGGEYLAQQVGTRLGFDEVSVGARPGETAERARLTIGKYLSPRLFVSYGVGLFQPGHFFRLQYDLGKGFRLSGESGVQQGGDLLYSIEP